MKMRVLRGELVYKPNLSTPVKNKEPHRRQKLSTSNESSRKFKIEAPKYSRLVREYDSLSKATGRSLECFVHATIRVYKTIYRFQLIEIVTLHYVRCEILPCGRL